MQRQSVLDHKCERDRVCVCVHKYNVSFSVYLQAVFSLSKCLEYLCSPR